MPTGPPPCHDESVMPDKTLPYLSPPLQKSYTEKPYQPYAASMAPPPALKVENPKLQQKSYPPALAPKPYLEKSTPERPYTTPPLHKEKPKPEDSFFSPAPALKPYQEKPKTEEKPYAAPLFPPPSKEEVPKSDKSEERTCTLGLVQEPFPEKPKLAPKEDKYKRQEKAYSPLPPPPYPPSPQPYSKSVAKPKPWAKTKIEEKPKPDMKSYPQKQPYLEEKIKSEKQKPQDHFTKVVSSRVDIYLPLPVTDTFSRQAINRLLSVLIVQAFLRRPTHSSDQTRLEFLPMDTVY